MSSQQALVSFIKTVSVLLIFPFLSCVNIWLFHPDSRIVDNPDYKDVPHKVVTIRSENLSLNGLFFINEKPKGTVLYLHGNAGNIYYDTFMVKLIYSLGYNLLVFDYRGFGLSEGSTSASGLVTDSLSALKYLIEYEKIPREDVVIWGRSLGGSLAANIAQNIGVRGVILESTFYSLNDAIRDHLGLASFLVLGDKNFETKRFLKNIKSPVLVIHSKKDKLIIFDHAERIYSDIIAKKSLLVITGTHNEGIIESYKVYREGVNTFLESISFKNHSVQ